MTWGSLTMGYLHRMLGPRAPDQAARQQGAAQGGEGSGRGEVRIKREESE